MTMNSIPPRRPDPMSLAFDQALGEGVVMRVGSGIVCKIVVPESLASFVRKLIPLSIVTVRTVYHYADPPA